MRISLTDAKGQLAELVRRAEAGEEVELTRHGQPVARLTPIRRPMSAEEQERVLADVRTAAFYQRPGPTAARSADFLYGDDGLPE